MASHDPRRFEAFRIDPAWFAIHRLSDGTEVTVRMLRPEDRASFVAGFERLSPESRYFRFFTPMPRLPESILRRLLSTDGVDHVALAAWRSEAGATVEAIGVARCIRLDGGDTAEAAIVVVDHMQGRGTGRLLLGHLCEAARERGIARFRAEVLVGNPGVAALLHDVQADAHPVSVDGNVAVYELDVADIGRARRPNGIPYWHAPTGGAVST